MKQILILIIIQILILIITYFWTTFSRFPPILRPPHQTNCLSNLFEQKHAVNAASDSQPQQHGTPFSKTYMIAPSLC